MLRFNRKKVDWASLGTTLDGKWGLVNSNADDCKNNTTDQMKLITTAF